MKLTKLQKKIYNLLIKIPKGKITTYKLLAKAIGKPKNWREIGKILNENPFPERFPCYKVVRSDGKIGGYSQSLRKKIAFLRKDGIIVRKNRIVNFKKHLFDFKI